MTDVDVPILIVGAGPTGLTIARELARHGVRDSIRLIDRAPEASRTSRALVVQARTQELYDDMGIIESMQAAGEEVPGLHILFTNSSADVRMDLRGLLTAPDIRSHYPSSWTISQNETERVLAEHLAEFDLEIERDLAVIDMIADDTGVTVTTRRGDGTQQTIRAGYVIGCDGAHSAVRKASGIPFEGSTYEEEFIMADAKLDWELPHGDLYVFPSKIGIMAAFSMPGQDRYRIFGNVKTPETGHSGEYSEPTHEEFQAMLDNRASVPAKVVEEYWVSRYRIHRRSVPRYRDGRIFLVGDAAHVHSPAGAQGMNTGIQDAYNLAWKLALVQRGVVTGANAEVLLDSFNDERHPVGVQLLKTSDRMFQIASGQGAAQAFMREFLAPTLAKTVLTRESFRRFFAGILSQLAVHYPKSPLNLSEGTHWGEAPEPGERAREADVQIDGTAGRMYDVFRGTHHTVLLFTGHDEGSMTSIELARIATKLEADFGDLVRARVVSAERFADHPMVIGDLEREVHKTYAVEKASAFIVRPDSYLAYRSQPVSADQITAYLTSKLS
ncbi:FAD-dependent monooxygenase [Fodinicola feengrottensis]|uniref:FAD-dependent monooxygenase n=2 Tax=Fodinicola feengrottensis TaxID=435914 RepID=A0ABN2H9X9_9ACTN